ncbi:MAG: glucosamine-6-phosphate deaminase [Bacteroidota bacterium]|nr:glucosamine-6-phosphate deaminase [Chitinophagaceae bacterium]
MKIEIFEDAAGLGKAAGKRAAEKIKETIKSKGEANIILATGTSQFPVLTILTEDASIDWGKVNMFHLDEYIGIPISHKASFRKYLTERFLDRVSPLKSFHLINGENEPTAECQRLNALISQVNIDLALAGIGENGHLAFNDPPADFDTTDPYIVVALDEACRKQQWGEGWFETMEEVPKKAISMSIQQIMKSKEIICSVPDERKALAVSNCMKETISNMHPASILQNHPNCTVFLDKHSASLIKK